MDPVLASTAAALIEEAAAAPAAQPAPLSSNALAQRFIELLKPESAVAAAHIPAVHVGDPRKTGLGGAILDSIQAMGDNYRVRHDTVVNSLNHSKGQSPGVLELMRLQVNINEMSLHLDVVTKAVSKAVQHIDTLTKLQ
ncbi:EscI/YscI/HrpB family type III secretion system inner rod protein [Variovorax sp. KK3]|uniref:EscI/YscI/HrpB family type III secretion system inner rod protein n=1 Tax=Variovorax sp. KK3 TaxID=1855728 RepID=UPI00097BDF54|nr:EscI/YscI/HrpB family type III secretion system inner rod protein [Variovorax sp. KK3]